MSFSHKHGKGRKKQEKEVTPLLFTTLLYPDTKTFQVLGFLFQEKKNVLALTLPPGWSTFETVHCLHTYHLLKDEKGRIRGEYVYLGNLFRKKSGYAKLFTRYDYSLKSIEFNQFETEETVYIVDNAFFPPKIINELGKQLVWHPQIEGENFWQSSEESLFQKSKENDLVNQAFQYLQQRYPDWGNPLNYWD